MFVHTDTYAYIYYHRTYDKQDYVLFVQISKIKLDDYYYFEYSDF